LKRRKKVRKRKIHVSKTDEGIEILNSPWGTNLGWAEHVFSPSGKRVSKRLTREGKQVVKAARRDKRRAKRDSIF
jgi:hypothetical protein